MLWEAEMEVEMGLRCHVLVSGQMCFLSDEDTWFCRPYVILSNFEKLIRIKTTEPHNFLD